MSELNKNALLAIETLRARVRELEGARREAIAIVGYAARLPGAPDAEAFWSVLEEGRDAVSGIPADRWDADAFYDADPDAAGKMFTRRAGFIEDVAGFDAPFFGISPREAMYMDPQHRILLETAWQALEHAALAPADLAGTRTGVFVGLSTHEYLGLLIRHLSYEAIDIYFGTGTSPAASAGRISYRLGFEGPAVTVDTACSSSLVAIHQASQALRAGECDLALAGGVNIILNPAPMINLTRARMVAPDGRCKTFDASADGYVRGEGCGVVVLKRLSDAERDGDRIRAVIRGSAVNQDGASGGLTVPSGRAQQRVIGDALRQAGLEPADVDYLEAHGTGTSLGDPIEVQAAAAALGPGRSADHPLRLGSVKTNIGHLEAAAGIAGVIKVVLAMEHEALPKHLHFKTPSPHIPWERLPVQVVEETTPWARTDGRRRTAGVSSFGFSGTNAHVLLEEAPALKETPTVELPERRYHLLPLSARTPEALDVLVARTHAWLEAHPDADIADVAHTAAVGRSPLEHRAALVVDSRARARRVLEALADERPAPGLFRGTASDSPKTAWLFTGQGSQYPGMGRELFDAEPVFRQTLERCDEVLREHLERPLLEVLFGEETPLGHTSYAQPALFALEMSLARLWEHWGLVPDVLLGHSVGQYAAACVAGVFSLDDGLRLLAERGKLFGALPTGGRMAAVFAEAGNVEERLDDYPHLSVAAYNGAHTVVSGPGDDVHALVERFQRDGVRCELIDTSHAFHSELIEPALDELETTAQRLTYRPLERTLICNRTGKVLTGQAVLDASYWRRHARQPVRFAESVQTLSQLGCKVLLEIGPQPVLSATALRAWPEGHEPPRAVASLRRDVPDDRQALEALAQLWVAGARVDFRALASERPHRKLDLPTYPFQHQRFWFDATRIQSTPSVESSRPPEIAERTPTAPTIAAPTPKALAPYERFLAIGEREIHVDLKRLFAESPTLAPKLLRELAESVETGGFEPLSMRLVAAPVAENASDAEPNDWLAKAPPDEREARLVELLRTELGRALHVPGEEIDPLAPFVTLGMDSLTAMELRSRVQAALGTSVPTTLFFTHPNAATLARGLLELWLETRADPTKRHAPIPQAPREGGLTLSHAQEQLWFLHELLPSSSAYNVALRVDVHGALDPATLKASFDHIVARHESLRTTFRSEMGVPRAEIATTLDVELPVHDVKDETEAVAWARHDADTPFDVTTGPLFRARVLRFHETRHVLLLTMHHLITDGWSFGVLLKELGTLYEAFRRGEPSPLSELPIQYADYAAWQRQWLSDDKLPSLLAFWKRDLEGAPALDFATDRPRPRTPSFRGARMRFELGRGRAAALRALSAEENVTLFAPLLAAFSALLHRYTGQEDFVVGTLTANRTRLEVENLIGFFVNALPVRIRLDGDPDVHELLTRMRRRLLDVMAHEDVPFELVVSHTAHQREANRNPLFQVQLVLQAPAPRLDLPGLEIDASEIDTETAKRDLTLTLFDDETLSGHVEYATDLFDATRIERWIEHFQILVDAMTGDRGARLSTLPLLTENEKAFHQARISPSTTNAPSIQTLFERAADRTPEAVAVRAGGTALTYRELDAAANRLARWLRKRGVGAKTPVALRVGRSVSMPIGFLGILKAGGVFIPIDPAYPENRIDYMLADAGAVLQVDDVDGPEILLESPERIEATSTPDHPAYVIYTSGSSGKPKGVKVTHGSVIEYADTLGRELGVASSDVYLHTASISFSSSIRQLVVPFAAGAAVAIASDDERRDPIALLERIRDSRVTVADLVPTVVRHVVDALAALAPEERAGLLDHRLRLLLTASDALRFGLVRDWRRQVGRGERWIHMYGQTETTGIVSFYPVPESEGDDEGIVPIGRPRGNVAMPVLDRRLRPLPCGVVGELYVGGPALAEGYTDPALTAERFLEKSPDDGGRLYATGDLVRLAWDGTLEFVGRADQQVKIRGLRVEPGEIERVLLEHPGVREAVIAVDDDGSGEKRLVAYFTAEGSSLSASDLRAHARQKLPEHMIPSAFVPLERLPLTPNGKLDRDALPRPERALRAEVEYVAPRPGVEEALASIWSRVLRIDRVGAGDSFFSLGGHSLLAVQVRAQVQSVLGVDLPLSVIFEEQTLSALALRIESTSSREAKRRLPPLRHVTRTETTPASYAQELMWQLEEAEPGSRAHWIDVVLRLRGPVEPSRLVRSVQAAVERHEVLRTLFRPSNGTLSQVVLGSWQPEVPIVDATEPGAREMEEPRYDLTACPPARARIVRLGPSEHRLHLSVHRILSDGLSMRLLLGEIAALYAGSFGATPLPLLDPSIQYADYATWERSWLADETLTRELEYFRAELDDGQTIRALPTDRPRPTERLRRGSRLQFELPAELGDVARATAARERSSLYMVLLAAFSSALSRFAGRESVVIGSPVSRRTQPATERMVGQFMNTLPLRISLPEDTSPGERVRHVKQVLLAALSHQDAPFHRVTAALASVHGHAATSIGEVALVMENEAPAEVALGELTLSRLAPEEVASRRELTLSIAANGDITGTVTYDRDLFEPETIQRIVGDFESELGSERSANL